MEKHPQVERQREGETEIEKNTVRKRHRLQREWRWRKETRETWKQTPPPSQYERPRAQDREGETGGERQHRDGEK